MSKNKRTLSFTEVLSRETKKRQKAIEKGLICFLCGKPLDLIRDEECTCSCFSFYPYKIHDMKEMIKIAKREKKGIYRKELKKECEDK
jgi:hypothetical protein